jgi:hypothetical protein
MSAIEKCCLCGKPCNPVLFLWSKRRKKELPVCGKCAPDWSEGGRMPQ